MTCITMYTYGCTDERFQTHLNTIPSHLKCRLLSSVSNSNQNHLCIQLLIKSLLNNNSLFHSQAWMHSFTSRNLHNCVPFCIWPTVLSFCRREELHHLFGWIDKKVRNVVIALTAYIIWQAGSVLLLTLRPSLVAAPCCAATSASPLNCQGRYPIRTATKWSPQN